MLFISHKNKVEKQQRKEAALAASGEYSGSDSDPGSDGDTGSNSDADTVS